MIQGLLVLALFVKFDVLRHEMVRPGTQGWGRLGCGDVTEKVVDSQVPELGLLKLRGVHPADTRFLVEHPVARVVAARGARVCCIRSRCL